MKYAQGCSACVHTASISVIDKLAPNVLTQPTPHNHEASEQVVVRGVTIDTMRSVVKNTPFQKLATTYSSVAGSQLIPEPQKVLVPSFQSVKSTLKRQRSIDIPKLPKSLEDICLEDEWTQTVNGSNFLMHKSAKNDMIIFASDNKFTKTFQLFDNLYGLSHCSSVVQCFIHNCLQFTVIIKALLSL